MFYFPHRMVFFVLAERTNKQGQQDPGYYGTRGANISVITRNYRWILEGEESWGRSIWSYLQGKISACFVVNKSDNGTLKHRTLQPP